MSDLAAITKAGIFVEVASKEVELVPLTVGDLGSLARYVQFQEWTVLKQLPGVPAEVLKEALLACTKKDVGINDLGGLSDLDSIIEILFLSARHKQPQITRDSFRDENIGKLLDYAQAVNGISGLLAKDLGKDEPQEPSNPN